MSADPNNAKDAHAAFLFQNGINDETLGGQPFDLLVNLGVSLNGIHLQIQPRFGVLPWHHRDLAASGQDGGVLQHPPVLLWILR